MRELKYPKYLEAGDVYGRLTVIGVDEESKIKDGKGVWPCNWGYLCLCECGNKAIVKKCNLCNGGSKSCGCLCKENIIKSNKAKRKTNPIEIDGDITRIFFFNTDNYAIVDTEDYDKVRDYCWHECPEGYARIRRGSNNIFLHKIIANTPVGKITDHINRDRSDNRKSNLRVCGTFENARNRGVSKRNISGHVGVHYHKVGKVWVASIRVNRKLLHIGQFKDIQDAIDARLKAEIKYFGEFAPSALGRRVG